MWMEKWHLKTQQMEGILWGLIVAILLIVFGIPLAFSLSVGIIIGVVAVFVLGTNNFCHNR